jgi:uncharacterized membrane protein
VIPHREIFMSGCSQMFAMAGSNEALRYVSYPTQVLGKSCKMVPVMAGGIILGGILGYVHGIDAIPQTWRDGLNALPV